uniref:Uncharacterized protein n=1 Tax=Amphimedon queenslandica TaxID=400682 RepID=A0A1X7VR46_AMPQE
MHEITKFIKLSPRREAIFHKAKQSSVEPPSPAIRLLCPTRWIVRADALKSVLDNYNALEVTWSEALDIVKDTEAKARLQGILAHMKRLQGSLAHMKHFSFYYAVALGQLILSQCDNLSRTLQNSTISAARQAVTALTVKTLSSIRSDESFDLFWTKTMKAAEALNIS